MAVQSLYSHPEAAATPDLIQRQQGFGMIDTLRRDPPGAWTGNKFQQSSKFTGPVYLAIKTIMTAMGSVVPQLLRRRKAVNKTTFLKSVTVQSFGRDYEYVPAESDHPVQQLLDHPNERGDTFKDVQRYLTLQHKLTGIAPLWTVPNAKHQPVELYPLPTALTTPQFSRSEQYPNGSYRLTPYYASGSMAYLPGRFANTGAVIPAEEIQRRRDPHPYILWDGYSPLSAGGVELDILEAIDQCWWAMLDHGVILDTLLLMPGQDPSSVTRFEQELKTRHGGARNLRRMFVLGGGDGQAKYDVKQLSPNVRDMDFPNGRATMLEFCLALFGVPMNVANMATGEDTFSALYASIKKFYLLTLQPDCNDWADCFSRWLCDPWSKRPGDYRIKMTLPEINDPELEMEKAKANVNILSVNQRLALEDKPPVEFGEYPEPIYLQMLGAKVMPKPVTAVGAAPGVGGPTQDEPPGRPDNPAGKGSRGPMMTKAAANTMDDPAGGLLVEARPKRRVLRGKKCRRALGMMVKAVLDE